MATQEPTAAPDPFVRLLRKSIASQGLSLREIGRCIGASTAYMSRLVNKKRGLPADETITKMEKTLNLEPGFYLMPQVDTMPYSPRLSRTRRRAN